MTEERARKVYGPDIAKETREKLREHNEEMFWMHFPHKEFEKEVREEYNLEFDIEEEEEE